MASSLVIATLLLALEATAVEWSPLAEDPFLKPYVAELKRETPMATLDRVKTAAATDLIFFHHGYGTWIRNKWLWGSRDPALVQFFRAHNVTHPDDMSMVLIQALWRDLNDSLTTEEQARIAAARALVVAKRAEYRKLGAECEKQLAQSRPKFDGCYESFGLPSKNPLNRDPFFKLFVAETGVVSRIVFFEGASPKLETCLRPIIEAYRFSSLSHDSELALYITQFPRCSVTHAADVY